MQKDVVIRQQAICPMCKGQKSLLVDGKPKACLCQRKALLTKIAVNARTGTE